MDIHGYQRTLQSAQCTQQTADVTQVRDDAAYIFIEPSFHLPQNKDILETQASHLNRNDTKSYKSDSKTKLDMSQFLNTKHQYNLGSHIYIEDLTLTI